MPASQTTCWTMIDAAARGSRHDREVFAQCYESVIRSYLKARWRDSALVQAIDDAVQEVFLECFRGDGPLARADRASDGGFRPFFFGVVRNVARRVESRRSADRKQQQSGIDLDAIAGRDAHLSRVFDRRWAESIMRRAADRQAERARESGDAAVRRVELLRLRFHEGLPIREIARRWEEDAAKLHHEYATARREFKAALLEIVAFHHTGPPKAVQQECATLLEMLG